MTLRKWQHQRLNPILTPPISPHNDLLMVAICVSSLEKCLFSSFAHFLIGSFIFLELSCMSCLYIFEINTGCENIICRLLRKNSWRLHLCRYKIFLIYTVFVIHPSPFLPPSHFVTMVSIHLFCAITETL